MPVCCLLSQPAHILLVDHSKFGTFVDDVRIPRKTPTHVADGSLIKFGMVKNLFRSVPVPGVSLYPIGLIN